MKGRLPQVGISPEFDCTPPDYADSVELPLARSVWTHVDASGQRGATAAEIAAKIGKTTKSIAGRLTELHATGYLIKSEAVRHGSVYLTSKKGPP